MGDSVCLGKASAAWLVLGDWGEAGWHQRQVAKQMGQQAAAAGSDFVALVGDNFYPAGVSSWRDPQWRTTYEDVYRDGLLEMPHYAILGNHDYMGSAQAQLDRSRKVNSTLFRMPAKWYSKELLLGNCRGGADSWKVLLLFLDTMVLSEGRPQRGERQEHWLWLQETLREASADWVMVFGHHPVFSSGKHGDASRLVRDLNPLLHQFGVDAYVAGHDHDEQFLRGDDGLSFVISGSGGKIRAKTNRRHERLAFFKDVYGFVRMSVNRSHLTTSWISENGELLHRHAQAPRRKVSALHPPSRPSRRPDNATKAASGSSVAAEGTGQTGEATAGLLLLLALALLCGCSCLCAAVFFRFRSDNACRLGARDGMEMEQRAHLELEGLEEDDASVPAETIGVPSATRA
eukprot:TRINITY_DN15001_c0_g1_i1.p1 TRINITY_DN15001_c0_g1~~TRINITY_DN15001_c0_g1_i1.p1  ORF type:complete len:425 (-),score=76.54 TRINITY_DN15001_c0_g1_i1:227-1435(-)